MRESISISRYYLITDYGNTAQNQFQEEYGEQRIIHIIKAV